MGVTAPNGLILMTEAGYLMLVKSFTDDLAWSVQRQLVNGYFRGQHHRPDPASLSRLEILQIAMEAEQGRIVAEAQRDEAVRTKAQIGSMHRAGRACASPKASPKPQPKPSPRPPPLVSIEGPGGADPWR